MCPACCGLPLVCNGARAGLCRLFPPEQSGAGNTFPARLLWCAVSSCWLVLAWLAWCCMVVGRDGRQGLAVGWMLVHGYKEYTGILARAINARARIRRARIRAHARDIILSGCGGVCGACRGCAGLLGRCWGLLWCWWLARGCGGAWQAVKPAQGSGRGSYRFGAV